MALFHFKAKKITGEETNGEREAKDKFELARTLRQENYILTEVEEEGIRRKKFNFSFLKNFVGASRAEKIIFTRNLGVMIAAGLSISRALEVLIRQAQNEKFKKIIRQVLDDLTKGKTLSESMSQYAGVFPLFYIAMLKAGESSGKIDAALKLMADQMQKDQTLLRKVRGAMVYPIIIIVAMIGIAVLMLLYVVPSLISTFGELGIELPLSTRVVIWLSKSLIANAMIIGIAFLAFLIGCVFLFKTKVAKKSVDALILKIPIISALSKKMNAARTARTLSSLISSGVDIIESLEVTTNVLQNAQYKKVLAEAKMEIQKGATIASTFRKAENTYPPMMAEMITVGEESGKLPQMLLDLAIFYEEEVFDTTKNLTTIIEPILMIMVGIVVGFFAIAMMRPMYTMVGAF